MPRSSASQPCDRAPTTTTGRPAMSVAVRGQPVAVQQQVLLAAQELGAVVGEALELGGQPAAGLLHLGARRRRRSSSRPAATSVVAGVARRRRRCGPAVPSLTRSSTSAPTLSTTGDARLRRAPRARGWGSGRRSSAQALTTADDPGVDERLGGGPVHVEVVEDRDVAGAAAGRAGWPYAGRPGRCRATPGSAGAGRERTANFMTAPWCQPAAARPPGQARPLGRGGASSSSRAWARAVSESSTPASIRDSSRSRPASSRVDQARGGDRCRRWTCATTTWRSAYAATWGRWVTTSTWAVRASCGQPAADLDRGLAADAGVDLVEDEGRHRAGLGQRDLEGQHHPGQLAAGGALVQRAGVGAGVGREQELDLVDAVRARRAASGRRRRAAGPPGVSGVGHLVLGDRDR